MDAQNTEHHNKEENNKNANNTTDLSLGFSAPLRRQPQRFLLLINTKYKMSTTGKDRGGHRHTRWSSCLRSCRLRSASSSVSAQRTTRGYQRLNDKQANHINNDITISHNICYGRTAETNNNIRTQQYATIARTTHYGKQIEQNNLTNSGLQCLGCFLALLSAKSSDLSAR